MNWCSILQAVLPSIGVTVSNLIFAAGSATAIAKAEAYSSTMTLLEPAPNGVVYSGHPKYRWSGASGEVSMSGFEYDLYVDTDSQFTLPEVVTNLVDTSQWQISPLPLGTRYWWKVIIRDSIGVATDSAVGSFRTYRPGDVNESHNLTAADIIQIVNFVFKSAALGAPDCTADIDGAAGVTAGDIVHLVAHVFRGGAAPEASCVPDGLLYWPLADGNYWLYELCWGAQPCIDSAHRMEVVHRGADTAVVAGPLWVEDTLTIRQLGSAVDMRWPDTAWNSFYRFEAGMWARPPGGMICNDTVFTAIPETDSIVTPAGTFYGCLRVQSAKRCMDGGLVAEWWAPGVGLVCWVQDNIGGYQYFYLTAYRAGAD